MIFFEIFEHEISEIFEIFEISEIFEIFEHEIFEISEIFEIFEIFVTQFLEIEIPLSEICENAPFNPKFDALSEFEIKNGGHQAKKCSPSNV